jgi:hypothetical protein
MPGDFHQACPQAYDAKGKQGCMHLRCVVAKSDAKMIAYWRCPHSTY